MVVTVGMAVTEATEATAEMAAMVTAMAETVAMAGDG